MLMPNDQRAARGVHGRETFYGKIIEPAIIVNTPTYFLIKLLFKTRSWARKMKRWLENKEKAQPITVIA